MCFLRRVQNKQSWRLIYQQSKFYFQWFFFPKPNRSRPSSCQDAKLYFTPFWKRGGQDQSNSRREQVWRWLGAAAGLTWIWDGCTLGPTHDLNTIEQHIKKQTQIKSKANSQTKCNRLRPLTSFHSQRSAVQFTPLLNSWPGISLAATCRMLIGHNDQSRRFNRLHHESQQLHHHF